MGWRLFLHLIACPRQLSVLAHFSESWINILKISDRKRLVSISSIRPLLYVANSLRVINYMLEIVGTDMHQLAVELDTFKNDFDVDGNHVAIDTTSISQPVAVESLNSTGVDLKSGKNITVIIQYNGSQNLIYVNVRDTDHPPKNVIKQPINLSDIVPSSVYVGFTAATGALAESHQLLEWSLTSQPLPLSE
ncbi:hypothetical protein CUMW_086420 [Citrus unshiu]|nr:hypothetical protein CUMW_086420 [Citrus unshiu]